MSSSEEMGDLSKDNDSSGDVSRDQSEKLDIKPTRTANGNLTSVTKPAPETRRLRSSRSLELTSVTEPASETRRLRSSRSLEVSNQPPTSSSQASNIHKIDEDAGIDSSQELRGLLRFSWGDDHVTSRQHTEISVSGLKDSDTSEAKTNKKDMSPVSAGSKVTSPPEQRLILTRSLPWNLKKEPYTSPEKRGVGTDTVASATKRRRITPKNDPCKPGSKTEFYRLNFSSSAPAKSSQTSPKVSNPPLSSCCHVPMRRNTAVTNVPSRVLKFNTPDKKGKIDQNRSDSSVGTRTPHTQSRSESTEMSDLRSRGSLSDEILTSRNSLVPYESNRFPWIFSQSYSKEPTASSSLGMHRRSASEGILTSENSTGVQTQQDQSDSPVKSHSKETTLSRSLSEISKVINRMICVVKPLFRGNPSKPDSTLPTNPQSSPSDRLMSGVTETLASNDSTTSKNNPEVQLRRNRNDPLQQRSHEGFLTRESFASSSPSEMVSRGNPPHVGIVEGQASTSNDQPIVTGGSLAVDQHGSSPDDSQFWNAPQMVNRVNPPHIDIVEGQASTSNHQPIVTGGSLPFSRHDSSSGNASERTPNIFDKHSEYVVQARSILRLVLKEMMHLNGDERFWTFFEPLFGGISESGSDQAYMQLNSNLGWYLAQKGYNLWDRILFTTQELHAETTTHVAFQRFIYNVVITLAFTLGFTSIDSGFDAFLAVYENFRSLYFAFAVSPIVYNLLSIQSETSINRIKILKEKLFKLWLRTLQAFRFLLMYAGENSDEASIMRFIERVRDVEDRTFLGRSKR